MSDDIIDDIIARLDSALKSSSMNVCYSDLLKKIGADVREDWCGSSVYISSRLNVRRDSEIIDLSKKGFSVAKIARKFGLTSRRVRQILA